MAETVAASTSREAVAQCVVIISLVGPCNHLKPLLSQAMSYCPTVAHLLKQICLTGEAWGSQNSGSASDWLQGW